MAPILHRRFPRVSGVLLAFIPFMIFVGVLSGTITGSLGDGAPSLLYLDGLSRLFVLLISLCAFQTNSSIASYCRPLPGRMY